MPELLRGERGFPICWEPGCKTEGCGPGTPWCVRHWTPERSVTKLCPCGCGRRLELAATGRPRKFATGACRVAVHRNRRGQHDVNHGWAARAERARSAAAPAPALEWERRRCAGRWNWRAGDPPYWCIEEPPESRSDRAEAAAHRRWLDREHPDRAGDWELWYSTPTTWLCLSFHPSLEAARAAAAIVVGDPVRMAELDGGRRRA